MVMSRPSAYLRICPYVILDVRPSRDLLALPAIAAFFLPLLVRVGRRGQRLIIGLDPVQHVLDLLVLRKLRQVNLWFFGFVDCVGFTGSVAEDEEGVDVHGFGQCVDVFCGETGVTTHLSEESGASDTGALDQLLSGHSYFLPCGLNRLNHLVGKGVYLCHVPKSSQFWHFFQIVPF